MQSQLAPKNSVLLEVNGEPAVLVRGCKVESVLNTQPNDRLIFADGSEIELVKPTLNEDELLMSDTKRRSLQFWDVRTKIQIDKLVATVIATDNAERLAAMDIKKQIDDLCLMHDNRDKCKGIVWADEWRK